MGFLFTKAWTSVSHPGTARIRLYLNKRVQASLGFRALALDNLGLLPGGSGFSERGHVRGLGSAHDVRGRGRILFPFDHYNVFQTFQIRFSKLAALVAVRHPGGLDDRAGQHTIAAGMP